MPTRRPRPGTAQGDEGYTNLLGRRRVPKHGPLMEAMGELDEASSFLGVARTSLLGDRHRLLVRQCQADLYEIMAELAFPPGHVQAVRLTSEHVDWLDRCQAALQAAITLNRFVLPGACPASAHLDVARAKVRTAERRLAQLAHAGFVVNPHTLAYVNRLSLVLYSLARAEDVAAGVDVDVAGAPAERPEL